MTERSLMKQIFATGQGQVEMRDVETPSLKGAGAIIETRFSAISVGTEGLVLRNRRQSPDPAAQAFPLGYSNAGVVVETSADFSAVRPGDAVACAGGGWACHSQRCYVPRNLIARCSATVDPREAAFSTLGAIAMQGVRRGRVELGEAVAVLGLGMIGQLAVQIAKAAGTRVIGIDLDEKRIKIAAQLGADVTVNAQAGNAVDVVTEYTQKHGVDVVLITAGSPNSGETMVQALKMIRHRGRVVVVGALKCEFPRDIWYYKDAELLIATSYGPGRYDPQYEDHGHDYPIGYVRWTEGRNLQEFVRLLGDGLVKVAPLITHEYPFAKAIEAYDTVVQRPGECLGVVLRY